MRFIPTCVGNIRRVISRQRPLPVHPHVCGEHFGNRRNFNRDGGSSPRVWGTCDPHHRQRYIPPVHPHVCGEHSPTRRDGAYDDRFIPTCVGNMSLYQTCSAVTSGSSPRVWGTCRIPHETGRSGRFIPTCVGNMRQRPLLAAIPAVHPHVCGEHGASRRKRVIVIGSSPRVWGTCGKHRATTSPARFIPTCVGNMGSRPTLPTIVMRFIPTCVGNISPRAECQ